MNNKNFRGVRSTPPQHQINNILNNKSAPCVGLIENGGISTIFSPLPWNLDPNAKILPFFVDYTSDSPSQEILIPEGSAIISGKIKGTVVGGNEGANMLFGLIDPMSELLSEIILLTPFPLIIPPNGEYDIDINVNTGIINKERILVGLVGAGSIVSVNVDITTDNMSVFQYSCK